MKKYFYIGIEITKIIIISLFLEIIYQASIVNNHHENYMVVIGSTFLAMLGTVIVSSILLDIIVPLITTSETRYADEWEILFNNDILQNFTYILSIFFIAIMVSFALKFVSVQILFLFKVGFLLLVITNSLSRLRYTLN